MSKRILSTIIIVLGLMLLRSHGVDAADLSLKLEPQVVQIGAFYNGTTVEVQGSIPADAEALVRVVGDREELHLKKKGKAGGLLWMNTGDVTFRNAPKVFMLYTSKETAKNIESPQLGLGFAVLQNQVEISPADGDNDFLFKEFVRLKYNEGLYTRNYDVLQYGISENGMKSLQTALQISPRMQPGSYTVELIVIRDGKVVGKVSEPLKIKQVGFPAQLSALAFGHSLLYGVLAVLIAIAAGLLSGVLFKGKGKGGAH